MSYIFDCFSIKNETLFYFQSLLSYFLSLGTIIPISLYVSLEFIAFFHSILIEKDVLMYSLVSRTYAKCSSLSLNENLSRINIVFTDKTGTLTCNILSLEWLSIWGQLYNSQGISRDVELETIDNSNRDLIQYLNQTQNKEIERKENFIHFMECALLCNNIYTSFDQNQIISASADEKSIIDGIRNFGNEIIERSDHRAQIRFNGLVRQYEILHKNDFSWERRCMSIIVRNERGEIFLLIKGADENLFNMCHSFPNREEIIGKIKFHIQKFTVK